MKNNINNGNNDNLDDEVNSFPNYVSEFPNCLSDLFACDKQLFIQTFFNFNKFLLPGLYAIINKKTNKIYFGESEIVGVRLAEQFEMLMKGRSEVADLLADWQE